MDGLRGLDSRSRVQEVSAFEAGFFGWSLAAACSSRWGAALLNLWWKALHCLVPTGLGPGAGLGSGCSLEWETYIAYGP